jgi:hypothetical protein
MQEIQLEIDGKQAIAKIQPEWIKCLQNIG